MAKPSPVEGGLFPETPVAQAAQRALASRLKDVRQYEDQVLTSRDVDAVHDMRVATRRMRAAIALFGMDTDLEEARVEVKRLGDALGDVRDLDVMQEWLKDARKQHGPAAEPGIDQLHGDFESQRADPEHAMRTAVERWRGDVAERLAAQFAAAGGPGKLAGHRERSRLRKKLKRLGADMAATLESMDPHTAHQLRIRAKKLRYHAELLADALPDVCPALLDRLQPLQELLGDLHDADVRRPLIERFLINAEPAHQAGALALLRHSLEVRDKLAGDLTAELRHWHDAGFIASLRDKLG
jgi:CHAD domain-containing protein